MQVQLNNLLEVLMFALRRIRREHDLNGSFARKDRPGSPDQNLEVEPKRPDAGIPEVQANHVIELNPAAPLDLPQPGNSRSYERQPLTVPPLVTFEFVADRWAGAH